MIGRILDTLVFTVGALFLVLGAIVLIVDVLTDPVRLVTRYALGPPVVLVMWLFWTGRASNGTLEEARRRRDRAEREAEQALSELRRAEREALSELRRAGIR